MEVEIPLNQYKVFTLIRQRGAAMTHTHEVGNSKLQVCLTAVYDCAQLRKSSGEAFFLIYVCMLYPCISLRPGLCGMYGERTGSLQEMCLWIHIHRVKVFG